jgi:acyl-homoserine lactone acylase PvdQ
VIARASVDGAPVAITKERAFWMHETDTVMALLRAAKNTTQSVEDFRQAMSIATMSFNAIYVDPDSLGYFHVGRFPLRAQGVDPHLPSWGTGEWEWQGMVDFADQPQMVNPARGWLVNWNNQPARGWDNSDSSLWGPTQRVKLLSGLMSKLFAGGSKASLEDVVNVVRKAATMDGNAMLLGPKMVRVTHAGTGAKRDAFAALNEWMDAGAHRLDKDRDNNQDFGTAVALWDTWYDKFIHNVFDDEVTDYTLGPPISDNPADGNNGSSYYTSFANYLWNLLGKSTRGRMSRDYCDNVKTDKTETCAKQVNRSWSQAVKTLTKRFGSNMSKWHWPADYIEFSEVGALSVDPIPWQNRGTYNHAIEVTGL